MSTLPPPDSLFSEMQRMKRQSMLLFFAGGSSMAFSTFLLPTRDPVSGTLGQVAQWIFALVFLLGFTSLLLLWRRPRLVLSAWFDVCSLLLSNLCVLLSLTGETLLFRSQFSSPVILWPLVMVAGFMSRRWLPLQAVLSGLSLLVSALLKGLFLSSSSAVTLLVEVVVGLVPLLITGWSVAFFRQAAVREAQQLQQSVNTDFLTGLANRRALFEQFPQVAGTRAAGQRVAVVLLDLDHFKRVNDQFGHQVGDEVLVAFAACLQAHARPGELTVRLGGEEFVWVLLDSSLERFLTRVEGLCTDFSGLPAARGVTVSAGVVPVGDRRTLTDALNTADKLLYQAKESGRNQVRCAGEMPTRVDAAAPLPV